MIDEALRELFPDDELLQRWLDLAPERVAFQGLPARICWLGFGDRARAGLAINELVRSGAVKAPVVIGRDHLDAGSVASPYRETEAMRDGSDAIADWPILNALVNVAAGATWVSVHHGGGVGIGLSIHAGMVVVADGTEAAAERLERVLTTGPRDGRRPAPRRRLRRGRVGRARARLEHADVRRDCLAVVARLLVRDLAQLATPVAAAGTPRRGPDLAAVEVLEDAYVLCDDGHRSSRSGGCETCRASTASVEELDGAGLCAVPGLVDCHTHPAWGGDRVEEFSLRAGGASYEELHAAGGGILSTVRATRALGEDGLRERVARHRAWMLGHGTTTWEGKSGYGLDRETELASLRAVAAAGGSPTWLGAHAVPPESDDGDTYLEFALGEVLPEAAALADAADVFLERGAFDAAQARRFLRPAVTPGLRCDCTATSSPSRERSRLRSSWGRARSTTSRRPAPAGVAELASSDVAGVLLPASALFLDRPMPPARALVDAGAAIALATDFNPGSAFTTSLPLVCSLACTQLHLSPAEALTAVTVNAAHVLGVADRVGRIANGLQADLVLLDAPDWRYLAYHLAGDVVAGVVKDGQVAFRR